MVERPTFSVVIPCYNYGHYLPGALESVFAQRRDDIEILLIDDASTDDTPQVAQRYGERLHYSRNEHNVGAGGAWCLGLSRARGRYVVKLDADDELLPGALTRAEKAFLQDGQIGMVLSSVLVAYEKKGTRAAEFVTAVDRTYEASELRAKLLHSFFFRMPGCVLRTSILEGHEPPDSMLYQIHDWEYFLRVTRGHKAHLLHEPGAVYRIHDRSITATAQFDNRLYNDILRWLNIAEQPGDRHIEGPELRLLRGSCAELLMIGFGPKLDPMSYIRYAAKYAKAVKLAAAGGVRQLLRLHLGLLTRISQKLGMRLAD